MDFNMDLLDYKNERHPVVIEDFEDVLQIFLTVLSGDEQVTVYYKDDRVINFDPMFADRFCSFYDGECLIYDKAQKIDFLSDDLFKNRTQNWVYENENLYVMGYDHK